jgi:hypothetical protein
MTATMRSGVVSIFTIDAHLGIDAQSYSDPTPRYTRHTADPVPSYSETEDNTDVSRQNNNKPMKVYSGARGGLARSIPITVPNPQEQAGSMKTMLSSLGARKAPSKKFRIKHRWIPENIQQHSSTATAS